MAGPQYRQKLQPRNENVLNNLSDRYYKARNVEGMRRINQEFQDRIQNHPLMQPGTGFIFPGRPEEGRRGVGQDSFWNVKANQPDQSGIMQMSPAQQEEYQTADASGIFNLYDQYKDKFGEFDFGDKEYSYNYDMPLGPGNLNVGGRYDFDDDDLGLGVNYSMTFNRGGIASL